MSRRTITRELRGAGEARLLERLADYQLRKVINSSVNLLEIVDILRLLVAGTLFHQLVLSTPAINQKRAITQISRAIAGILKLAR